MGSLRKWFKGSKSEDGKSGWVNVVTGGTCASDEPGEGTPKCVSSEKRASMTKAERLSAARRKKAADPGQQSKSGAATPTYVSTDKPEMNEQADKPGKGSGTKDACYTKVKSRYSVWPSAYASGALVKCRKVGAANWGNKTEGASFNIKHTSADTRKAIRDDKLLKRFQSGQEGSKIAGQKLGGIQLPLADSLTIDIKSKDPLSEAIGMIRYCPKCEKNETREECRYGPKFWDMYSMPSSLSPNQMKFNIAQVHPANESTEYDHIEEGHKEIASGKRKDREGYMARNELDTVMKAVSSLKKNIKKGNQQLPAWVQSKITKATDYIDTAADYIDSGEEVSEAKKCWPGYKKKGTQKLFGKTYNRCVKEGNRTFSQFMGEASAAWQRKEGKNPEGGLNAKGVASYRRENPGSKLQTAVTTEPSKLEPGSKDAKRRKSFCARMGGMPGPMKDEKGRPTRKALSLRKWNC
jgi:hypothetical protein